MSDSNQPFTVSEAAVARIRKIMAGEPEGTRFWVRVNGGGCSGFSYNFALDQAVPQAEDMVLPFGDVSVAVDEVSLPFVKGAMLDYLEDLSGAGFEMKNPNAASSCGCGNSFSVKM